MNFIAKLAIWAIPVLFAITVHEVAHGWVAYKFGDKTAWMMGRLTLNPIKHIDPIGTILVPLVLLYLGGFMFGWAKPVPVNFSALRNPRRDMAIVAAAGPLTNFLMALAWALIFKIAIFVYESGVVFAELFIYMAQAGIIINLIIMVLNLIPIPPLDGSRVVSSLLSPRAAYEYNRLEPYGFFILLFLIVMGWLSNIIGPVVNELLEVIVNVFGLR